MQQGGTASPYSTPGAATEENTYRCIALPGGGLGPLPRQTDTYSRPEHLHETEEPEGNGYCVTGFTSVGVLGSSVSPKERLWAYEYVLAGVRSYTVELDKEFDGSGVETLEYIVSADPSGALAYKSTTFGRTRSNITDPAEPGVPLIVFAWYVPGGGYEKIIRSYPRPQFPDTYDTYAISDTIPADILVHQGRVVLLAITAYDHGPAASWATNEDMYWTAVNDISNISTLIPVVFVPENPTGYGTWASMSANELLLIKNAGGGLTLNGDLNDPTVVNLPNVVPTGFLGCIGTSSPIGFIYGSWQAGVWVWNGGDVSQKISNQLEDDVFTVPNANLILGQKAQFEAWHDWVVTSNNWLFDTNNGSWWRLDDPDDVRLQWFSTDDLGEELLCSTLFFTNADPVHGYTYNRSSPARSYSWQSQPLWASVGRDIDISEIVLIAHGTGTIAVTVSDYAGVAETHEVTLASNTPDMIRFPFHTRGKNVKVRLEVGDGVNPAPIIYSIDVAYAEGASVPVTMGN